MSEQNLQIWDKVKNTDPAYTKPFSSPGGHKGTSISGAYMVMKATELWGPVGLGWGYNIIEERIDTGAPVYNAEGETLGHTMTHTLRLNLWFKDSDGKHEVEHFGHTPYVYYSTNYKKFITDGEAPKKSLTDAIKKCLSMFGFSADIFLGLYDDVAYVQEAAAAFEIEKSDDAAETVIKQRQEYEEWKDKHFKFMETATNINELELLFTACVRKATRKSDTETIKKLTKIKDKRKQELEEAK